MKDTKSEQKEHKILFDFLISGLAAAITKCAIAPIDRVKILLQVDGSILKLTQEQRFKGITDCVCRIQRE